MQLIIKDRLKNNITPSAMGLFDVLVVYDFDNNQNPVIKITLASGLEKPDPASSLQVPRKLNLFCSFVVSQRAEQQFYTVPDKL